MHTLETSIVCSGSVYEADALKPNPFIHCATSSDAPHVTTLVYSLLNFVLSYNPAGSLPYALSSAVNLHCCLLTSSSSSLIVPILPLSDIPSGMYVCMYVYIYIHTSRYTSWLLDKQEDLAALCAQVLLVMLDLSQFYHPMYAWPNSNQLSNRHFIVLQLLSAGCPHVLTFLVRGMPS